MGVANKPLRWLLPVQLEGRKMATIYMAKNGDTPLGFYSTYPLAASLSSDVVEIDIPFLEGTSNGCVFYADWRIIDSPRI